MKAVIACLAGCAIVPAWAQSGLPEGSADLAVAVAVGTAPSAPGSAKRSTFLLPQFTAEWSNGVFVDGLALGIQLSREPMLKYGVLVALDLGAQRADGSHGGMRPVAGAFVDYQALRELSLHAHVTAPAGLEGAGVLVNLRAGTDMPLTPHSAITAGVGINLANARYGRSMFGTADYRPAGGMRDAFADARWHWQVSPKVTLTASLQVSRLQGDAAASPRTQRRTGVTNWLALEYGY